MSRSHRTSKERQIKQYHIKKFIEKQTLNKALVNLEKQYQQRKNSMNAKKLKGQKISAGELSKLCQVMNIIAVKLIKQGQLQKAQDWLLRAQKYATQLPKMQITIENNLACLYKKQQNYGLALSYLQKADSNIQKLIIKDKKLSKDFIIADCSLNMCSILSSMGEHLLALQQARKTIICLQNIKNMKNLQIQNSQNCQQQTTLQNKYYKQVYLVAKFNQAVELQHLHKLEKSLECFKQALDYGMKYLNKNSLILQIKKAIQSIQKKVQSINVNKNRTQKNWNFRSINSSPKLERKDKHYESVDENCQTYVKSLKNKIEESHLKISFKENFNKGKTDKSTPLASLRRIRVSILKHIN